jgi:hypothetical protein
MKSVTQKSTFVSGVFESEIIYFQNVIGILMMVSKSSPQLSPEIVTRCQVSYLVWCFRHNLSQESVGMEMFWGSSGNGKSIFCKISEEITAILGLIGDIRIVERTQESAQRFPIQNRKMINRSVEGRITRWLVQLQNSR